MSEEESRSTSNVAQAAEEVEHEVDKVLRNSSVRELLDLGKELGLVDADLREFVRDQ